MRDGSRTRRMAKGTAVRASKRGARIVVLEQTELGDMTEARELKGALGP